MRIITPKVRAREGSIAVARDREREEEMYPLAHSFHSFEREREREERVNRLTRSNARRARRFARGWGARKRVGGVRGGHLHGAREG